MGATVKKVSRKKKPVKKKAVKTGRPTKYDPACNDQVVKLCKLGATDEQIADFFNVDVATIYRWKNEHKEFCDAIKKGKIVADSEVASSLFHRAIGYEHEDVDIKMYEGSIIKTKLVKHYPPDPTAAIFWLKNRAKEQWRDKQEVESRNITYSAELTKEEIKQLDKQLENDY